MPTNVLQTDHANQLASPAAYVWTGRSAGDAVVDLSDRKITGGRSTGLTGSDYVTVTYVQDFLNGKAWKDPAEAATTEILDNNTGITGSPTYTEPNITATLAVSGVFAVDGYTFASSGESLLVKNEAGVGGLGGAANGVYTVTISGTSLTLSRRSDANAGSELPSATLKIKAGTANADFEFTCTNDTAPTLGTTVITFVQSSGSGSVPDATSGSGGGTKGKVTFDSDFGLSVTSGVAKIVLESSTPTLKFTSGELGVKFSTTTSGLEATASGLSIDTEASNPTLQISGTNELGVKFDSTGGLATSVSGLIVQVDGTTITKPSGILQANASALGVEQTVYQELVLNATDITNKYKDISNVPVVLNSVQIDVIDNTTGDVSSLQRYDVDFKIKSDGSLNRRLTWAAADVTEGMEDVMASGDIIRVWYTKLHA